MIAWVRLSWLLASLWHLWFIIMNYELCLLFSVVTSINEASGDLLYHCKSELTRNYKRNSVSLVDYRPTYLIYDLISIYHLLADSKTKKLLPSSRLRLRRSFFLDWQRFGMLACSDGPRFRPRWRRGSSYWPTVLAYLSFLWEAANSAAAPASMRADPVA